MVSISVNVGNDPSLTQFPRCCLSRLNIPLHSNNLSGQRVEQEFFTTPVQHGLDARKKKRYFSCCVFSKQTNKHSNKQTCKKLPANKTHKHSAYEIPIRTKELSTVITLLLSVLVVLVSRNACHLLLRNISLADMFVFHEIPLNR